jgi:hypothetical protein
MPVRQHDRTSEPELAVAVLRIAADTPTGEASTTLLKKLVPEYINLTQSDVVQSQTRPNELMFHQIVGNVVSHRESDGNIIQEGYAEYTGSGIRITSAGRDHLKRMGYSP